MEAVDSAREASRRALDAERLRSSRVLGRIRFIGITIAFVFNWLLPTIAPGATRYQASLPLFAAYWLAAALVFRAVRLALGSGLSGCHAMAGSQGRSQELIDGSYEQRQGAPEVGTTGAPETGAKEPRAT